MNRPDIDPNYWSRLAQETFALAASHERDEERRILIDIAVTYERMARHLANKRRHESGPASPLVIVVEDEFQIAHRVMELLEEAGCTPVGPFSALDIVSIVLDQLAAELAVLIVERGTPALFSVADTLADKGTPFFFVTAHDGDVIPQRHADKRVLQIPLNAADFHVTVQSLLKPSGDIV
jgi:hypothetical protein